MSAPGRPLRFVATLLSGWVLLRTALLWPDLPVVLEPTRPPRVAAAARPTSVPRPASPPFAATISPPPLPRFAAFAVPQATSSTSPLSGASARTLLAMFALIRFSPPQAGVLPESAVAEAQAQAIFVTPLSTPVERSSPGGSRWSGSLWFLARGGTGLGGPYGGQLGGDQAGARIAYSIDHARHVAIVGRIASPLAGVGREAAIGVEWQPTRLPVRLVAEHRFAIDGGGGGPAIGIVGGAGPVPIGAGFRVEGYAQAGIIGRDGVIGYGDGAVRLTRPITAAAPRRVQLDAGAGAWGGIQPGAERLDIGPTVAVRVPVVGRTIRLAVDWRERVGGAARPGSGLALSIGTDF